MTVIPGAPSAMPTEEDEEAEHALEAANEFAPDRTARRSRRPTPCPCRYRYRQP